MEDRRYKRTALWDPNVLRKALGLEPETKKVGGKFEGGVEKAVGTRETVTDSSPRTTLDMLRAEEKPLLLVLDEAPKLGALERLSSSVREAHWKIYLKIFITAIWANRSYFWLQVWG